MSIIQERIKQFAKTAVFSVTPPFPRVMMLEPSNMCNLTCCFCPGKGEMRKPKIMELGIAEKALQEGYEAGAREVGLYCTGESFVNPNLDKIVGFANDIGYEYIYLTTNGVLATKKNVEALVKNGLHSLKFSINAGTPESYKKVHGKDAFEQVIANLYSAKEILDKEMSNNVSFKYLSVSAVYVDDTFDELTRLKEKISPILHTFDMKAPINRVDDAEGYFRSKCILPFNRIHVTSEGFLTFCCVDFNNELTYADLRIENMGDAWHNALACDFREKFLKKDVLETRCGKCGAYQKQVQHISSYISEPRDSQ